MVVWLASGGVLAGGTAAPGGVPGVRASGLPMAFLAADGELFTVDVARLRSSMRFAYNSRCNVACAALKMAMNLARRWKNWLTRMEAPSQKNAFSFCSKENNRV